MKKKYIGVLSLFSSILLAFFLRIPMFLHGDFYLLSDQGRDLQLAKQIVVDHKITLIGGHAGFGGLFHGPLWWYMITPFLFLSAGNPFFTLIPLYLLVSLGIVICGFFMAKKLFDLSTALLFTFILGTSQAFISTISFTSNSQVMPLIFLFFIYCSIQYLRGKTKYIVGLLFLTGIGINFEAAFAITLIPLILLVILISKKIPAKKFILLGIIALLIPLLSYFIFDLRHDFLMSKSVLNLISGKFQVSGDDAKLNNLLFRAQDRSIALSSTIDFIFSAPSAFNKLLVYIVFFITGISFFLKRKKEIILSQENKELGFIFLIPIVVGIFYMFIKLPIQGHYIVSLGVSSILLFTLAIKKIGKISSPLKISLIILFIMLQINPLINFIKNNYFTNTSYNSTSNGSYLNQQKVVDSIFKDAKGKPFGYFVFDLPIVTYSTDYLFWWKGETVYHYLPQSKKLPITYLILNPAKPGDLHAHDFWIANTIHTNGQIIKKWTMPGNIIILKLSIPKNDPPVDPNYYQDFIFR